MSKNKFYMFVDEVKAAPPFDFYNFTGIVIKESDYLPFENSLNCIKDNSLTRLGGRNVNLHFTKLIRRDPDSEFSTLSIYEEQSLWTDLYKLFLNTNYHILAGVVHKNYNKCFTCYKTVLEIMSFKVLLENYVRYLYLNNGYGEVMVESSNDDEKLREEYYKKKFFGSRYISAEGYSSVLRSIKFETKIKLIAGLQLADFIANPISRMINHIAQFDLSKFGKMDYSDILNSKIYDGGIKKPFEYGVKKIFL